MGSPGTAPAPAAGSGLQDNVAGALAYCTIIPAIIFLVVEPYNKKKFVRFHAFQCLFLAAALLVVNIGLGIVFTMLAFGGMFGGAFQLINLVQLAELALVVVLIYNAYNNKMFKLPVIGDLAEKQAGA